MKLAVDFWDVGQGDCSVIHLPGTDGIIIVDTGPRGCSLKDWIQEDYKGPIHAIILTHNDADHTGCLEDILKRAADRVGELWLVPDRSGRGSRFAKVHNLACQYLKEENVLEIGVTGKTTRCDIYQWADAPTPENAAEHIEIFAVHPDLPSRSNARKKVYGEDPNQLSAVLCLRVNGNVEAVWGGDAPMQAVARTCEQFAPNPKVLFGPHHGAPIHRELPGYAESFSKIDPDVVFVSVGTTNAFGQGKVRHPLKQKFLHRHRDLGRRICCTELVHCLKDRIEHQNHLLKNHYDLGMRPPKNKKYISCRGAMRLEYKEGEMVFDKWHAKHAELLADETQIHCRKKTKSLRSRRPKTQRSA